MAAIASPEFVSLCRTQLRLLTGQMGTCSAAIYIADVPDITAPHLSEAEKANFVPVTSYPESLERWEANFERAVGTEDRPMPKPTALLPGNPTAPEDTVSASQPARPSTNQPARPSTNQPARPSASQPVSQQASVDSSQPVSSQPVSSQIAFGSEVTTPITHQTTSPHPPGRTHSPVTVTPELETRPHEALTGGVESESAELLHADHQLVVPLVYAKVVVGLLIAIRRDRTWSPDEHHHIEAVAQSLAAGCVLERRNHWLQGQLSDKRSLQQQQSEVFHNLLHQFRNPLTAVNTFGKLLVRRLDPEDRNQPVATGIVRESQRLRELVSHFDEAVALGDADLATDLTPEMTVDMAVEMTVEPTEPPQLPAAQPPAAQPLLAADSRSADRRSSHHLAPPSGHHPSHSGLGQPLTLSAQSLNDVIEPVLAVARIVAIEQDMTLHSRLANDTPPVWGEAQALREVISNLVDNAIKYSPAGSQVWVQTGVSRFSETGEYQGIAIGDTGPGIPECDRHQLFERNFRGVQAQGDLPGTGLGLAIAQSLVTAMQGHIEVVSPAAGTAWMPIFDSIAGTTETKPINGPGSVFIIWLLEV